MGLVGDLTMLSRVTSRFARGAARPLAGAGLLPLLGAGLLLVAAAPLEAATLTLPATGVAPGTAFSVPITIDNASGILGTDLVITYTAATLQATAVSKTAITNPHTLTTNLATPGVIRISLFGTTPLSGSGNFLLLNFSAVGGEGTTSPLHFQSAQLNEGMIAANPVDGGVCVRSLTTETQGLMLSLAVGSVTDAILSWSADQFADTYNVYRGLRADLADLACLTPDVAGLSTGDGGGVLAPGSRFVYYVTGANCRGESTAGFMTGGAERVLPLPCP